MTDLQKKLRWILTEGNLTIADLARWLDRPHATVTNWMRGGNIRLAPFDADKTWKTLNDLQSRISQKDGFPIPTMPFWDRREYIMKMREQDDSQNRSSS